MTAFPAPAPSANPSVVNDPALVELLRIGPIGGIDATTAPPFIAPFNLFDATNLTSNTNYGAFTTVLGRTLGFTLPLDGGGLPRIITGITSLEQTGQPTTFIVAATNQTTNKGELWSSTLGGSPSQRTIPTLPSSGNAWLTPNLQTYFATLGKWIFLTNGTDTPLKIDSSLNVTQWGIIAPSTAPSVAATTGGAMTPGGTYTYCVTFGNSAQESSQGVISTAFTLVATPSVADFGGVSGAGDTVTVQFAGGASFSVTVTLNSGLTASQVCATVVSAINAYHRGQPSSPVNFVSANTFAVGNELQTNAPAGVGAVTCTITIVTTGTLTISTGSGTPFSVTAATQAVALSGIPTSSDPQVTERNIYRIGGALGQWRLVHTIADNTTTTYTDTTADSALTGQSLTVYRDPPPAFAYICTHQNRVWGFYGSGSLYFSNYNEPWGFNSNTGILYCNSTTLDDGAVALWSLGSVLMCFKKRTTFLCYGSTDLSFQTYFAFNRGCTSARSAAGDAGQVWWESRQGVYYYNGASFDPVGNNMSSGKFQVSNFKKFLDSLVLADRAVSCAFFYDSMYHISFPTKNVTYFYDPRIQQWLKLGFATPVAWYDIEDQTDVVGVNNATQDECDSWFTSGGDLGGSITATLSSRRTHGDHIEQIKTAKYAAVDAPQQAGTAMALTLIQNPGPAQAALPALNFNLGVGGPQHVQDFQGPNEWMSMALSVSITTSAQVYVEQISIWGQYVRGLPNTLNDGA